jgi:hypothetical protein
MTKTPRVLFDTGLVTNWNSICKKFFFMYDQRPSVSNRDLATMVRAPHEGCDVHRIRLICLGT